MTQKGMTTKIGRKGMTTMIGSNKMSSTRSLKDGTYPPGAPLGVIGTQRQTASLLSAQTVQGASGCRLIGQHALQRMLLLMLFTRIVILHALGQPATFARASTALAAADRPLDPTHAMAAPLRWPSPLT